MLDYRMNTFMTLCETMHYGRAAKALNMTQPGVTGHIQYLEKAYGCDLFHYDKRHLTLTQAGQVLLQYTRSQRYNEDQIRRRLLRGQGMVMRLGATKTIGAYVVQDKVLSLVERSDIDLTFVIDNTDHLLSQLNQNTLDLILLEGFFDKSQYDYEVYRREAFMGICSVNHPFAGKTIALEALFDQHLIIREEGSGTRAICQQLLGGYSHQIGDFRRVTCISSFDMIRHLVSGHDCITFGYEAIAAGHEGLRVFQVEGLETVREFNLVSLKDTDVSRQKAVLMGRT